MKQAAADQSGGFNVTFYCSCYNAKIHGVDLKMTCSWISTISGVADSGRVKRFSEPA